MAGFSLPAGRLIVRIRDAQPEDGEAMLALMPRLADFDLPAGRAAEELYSDDARLMHSWLAGSADDCLVQVAVDDADGILGFTLTRMRPDALNHEPSAHLEAIAVAPAAEGQGAGRALLAAAEANAASHGAHSLTLHVISTNVRAIDFYERAGYFGEMRRYIKRLDTP
jgi:ribosomal protein S18 acetylase RimI-like enzyme